MLPPGLPPRPEGPIPSPIRGNQYRTTSAGSNLLNSFDRQQASRDDPIYQFRGNENGAPVTSSSFRQTPSSYRPEPPSYSYDRDSYQPRYDPPRYDDRPPPRAYDNHDRSPPRHYDDYDRPPARSSDTYRPAESRGFDFRYDVPQKIQLSMEADTYRQQQSQFEQQEQDHNGRNEMRRGPRRPKHTARGRGNYGNYSKKAAERPMLRSQRDPTPELMAGQQASGVKFKAIADMSDSEEADMDLSSEDEANAEIEQPKKKQARTDVAPPADGDSVPRWSNPDPYTALPPPDESQRKKKDMIKLIRKARVVSGPGDSNKTEAEQDDFISFDLEDDSMGEETGPKVTDSTVRNGVPGVAGAPTGPRFSHRDQIQDRQPHANGEDRRGSTVPQVPAHIDLTSDPALGSRKRNINDEIKQSPPRPRSTPHKLGGIPILTQWLVRRDNSGTPWCKLDHSNTSANMGIWLHKEIVDFYFHVKPQPFEETIRNQLVDKLNSTIRKRYHDARVCCFGSFPAGLYLPTADMDLVFVSDSFMEGGRPVYYDRRTLWKFKDFLERQGLADEGTIEIISKARVPLVKYVDKLTGLRVDISFENSTGLTANGTFQNWKNQFPAMPILVTLVKQFLAMRGLNEPVNGGIGGFTVTCLVVSLLQNSPQVQSRSMIPEHHLGELLMEFFDLYGNAFNTTTTAIRLNPPGYCSKSVNKEIIYKQANISRLSIIDPNNPSNDVSGGSSQTPNILSSFKQAFSALQMRMNDLLRSRKQHASIMEVILGGNYESFDRQRRHLQTLHERTVGPVLA